MNNVASIGAWLRHGAALPTVIAELPHAGFSGVSMNPQLLLELTHAARQDVASVIADLDLVVALHGSFDTPINELAGLIDALAPHLATVTFDPVLGWTSAGLLFNTRRMSSYLHQLDKLAEHHGFSYAVEDFPETAFALRMYRDDLAPLLESDRFGILIDVGHFNESVHRYGYYRGVTPEQHFAQLPLPLLEVHLSDNNGQEDQHLPLGMGIIDFASVARGLRTIAFDGLATIEIEPASAQQDPITTAKNQIVQSLAFWKNVVADQARKPVEP